MKEPKRFGELLTQAVLIIAAHQQPKKGAIARVQDQLGYALGREEGGSCIEYWRKGHIPAEKDVKKLAAELFRQEGLDQKGLEEFLNSAGYSHRKDMLDEILKSVGKEPPKPKQIPQEISPFVVGVPITTPRQFFGRERELKRIFGLWRRSPLQNMAVIGLKRSGKTSLLHYLKNITRAAPSELREDQRSDWLPQPKHYQWIFVDFQDARMVHLDSLLHHLLTSLGLRVPDRCNLENFMNVVSNQVKTPTVILMDELGVGLESPELDERFWGNLRSWVGHTSGGNLAFVLASSESPARLARDQGKASPFFNMFHSLKLGPLTDKEARELIASSPKPFAPADVEWILDQSGRWPCLLQILCLARLTALEEGDTGDAWREDGLYQIEPFRYLLER